MLLTQEMHALKALQLACFEAPRQIYVSVLKPPSVIEQFHSLATWSFTGLSITEFVACALSCLFLGSLLLAVTFGRALPCSGAPDVCCK